MGENKLPDNPQKRDLFAELSEMSVREVESQIPGTAGSGTDETEESEHRSWKNTIRTISQRKAARNRGAEGTSGSSSNAPLTEAKKEIKQDEIKLEADSGRTGTVTGSAETGIPDEIKLEADPGRGGTVTGSAETGIPDEVKLKADPDKSGFGALEAELFGASKNHAEEEEVKDASLELERELLSVRAESSGRSGKDVHPDFSEIVQEFEKRNEQGSYSGNPGTGGTVLPDEDTFYADIAANDNETRGPVNEPLKGERYDPLEEERERREKKDRLIRIILFTALMLVAGALLTYVTFIRDSGKKASDSSEITASAKSEKNGSPAADSAGTESGGTLTDSAPEESVEDISTEDLSVYLSEMPAEGTDIVSTADALYSYEQMVKDLYFLTNRYPDIIRTNIAATTLDQRAVYEVLIGNPDGSMHVVVPYGMRGSEYITTLLAMRQLEYYCQERSKGNVYRNHNYKEIFADVCIHVLPMVNPDGVTISQFGIDSLRTKAAKDSVKACYDYDKAAGLTDKSLDEYLLTFGANAAGVDISKNFPAGWSKYTGGAVQPSYQGYKGLSAGSEPETQAVMNAANDRTKGVVVYRATGNVIYWDYGSEGTVHEEAQHLAESLSTRSGYPLTALPKYDSSDAGGCADYFNEEGIPAVSLVVGEGTSPVDISAFPDIWTANLNILPMLANLYTNG